MGNEKNLRCEYESIRIKYLSKNMRTLLRCLSKRLPEGEFESIKKDLLRMIDDI